ncbi:MAG TPA: T9SS type A sorting domain-containing protein [Saprospiraceae bacterium]|nr:T9SS type A sorting domain-containing protein [Saprospiraceae bacterium]
MKKIKVFFIFLVVPILLFSQYKGTASVSQGIAATTMSNLYSCTNGRVTNIGKITAMDSTVWTMPAAVNFSNASFPFASDLYNPCTNVLHPNAAAALAALKGNDIITIDPSGELFTSFIFADNYFELYINGIPVGKDNVPFTQFNSNIVRFRVKRPFTIAMLLVDWEEQLGVGCENNSGFLFHPGDGGMVAVFMDSTNKIVAKTDSSWKAQCFYTSPIVDLKCPMEIGSLRLSDQCSTQNSNNGSKYYALHWPRPTQWMDQHFDDRIFPNAKTYTNAAVGVDNKPAYTNFTSLFDNPTNDAQFIWSSNLVLDNEVIVRTTVPGPTVATQSVPEENSILIYPNPANQDFHGITILSLAKENIDELILYNNLGIPVWNTKPNKELIEIPIPSSGIYFAQILIHQTTVLKKIIIQ